MPAPQAISDSQAGNWSPTRTIVERALAGEFLSAEEAVALIECDDLDLLLDAAAKLRDRAKGRDVTIRPRFFFR